MLASANIVVNSNFYAQASLRSDQGFGAGNPDPGYPNMLVASNDVPDRTVQELVALARANPGKLTFGHSGIGTTQHLSGELFKTVAGIDIQQVPYRRPQQIATDFLGGRIMMSFLSPSTGLPLIRE